MYRTAERPIFLCDFSDIGEQDQNTLTGSISSQYALNQVHSILSTEKLKCG